MRSLLDGLTVADIRPEPFPHVVVQDALPPDLYAALSETCPSFSRIGWTEAGGRVPNNQRYVLPADAIIDAPDLEDCWKAFAAYHSSPPFYAQVAALFRDYWPPALLSALGGTMAGHVIGRLRRPLAGEVRIHQDARIEINTPVRNRASSVRGPHLDTPERLFSGLFYLRHPADDSVGGDLILYRWRQAPPAQIDVHQFVEDAVEPVVTIPYRANQFVLFPQTIHSIHGVSPRQPTPHTRRYVFITAELAEPWLASPASGC